MKITNFKNIFIPIISTVILFSSSVYGASVECDDGTDICNPYGNDYLYLSSSPANPGRLDYGFEKKANTKANLRVDVGIDSPFLRYLDNVYMTSRSTVDRIYHVKSLRISNTSLTIGTEGNKPGIHNSNVSVKDGGKLYISGGQYIGDNVTIGMNGTGRLLLRGGSYTNPASITGTGELYLFSGDITLYNNIAGSKLTVQSNTRTNQDVVFKSTSTKAGVTLTVDGTIKNRLGNVVNKGTITVHGSSPVTINDIEEFGILQKNGKVTFGQGYVLGSVGDFDSDANIRCTSASIVKTYSNSTSAGTTWVINDNKWKTPRTTVESGGILEFAVIGDAPLSTITIKSGGKVLLGNEYKEGYTTSMTIDSGGYATYGTLNINDINNTGNSVTTQILNMDISNNYTINGKLEVLDRINFSGDIPNVEDSPQGTVFTILNSTNNSVKHKTTAHSTDRVKYVFGYSTGPITATSRFKPVIWLERLNVAAALTPDAVATAQAAVDVFKVLTNPTAAEVTTVRDAMDVANGIVDTANNAKEKYIASTIEFGENQQAHTPITTIEAAQREFTAAIELEESTDAIVLEKYNLANAATAEGNEALNKIKNVATGFKTLENPTVEQIEILTQLITYAEGKRTLSNDANTAYGSNVSTYHEIEDTSIALNAAKLNLFSPAITEAAKAIITITLAQVSVNEFKLNKNPSASDINTTQTAIDEIAPLIISAQSEATTYTDAYNDAGSLITFNASSTSDIQSQLDAAIALEVASDAELLVLFNDANTKTATANTAIATAKTAADDFAAIATADVTQDNINTVQQAMASSEIANTAASSYVEKAIFLGEVEDTSVANNANTSNLLNIAIITATQANIAIIEGQWAVETLIAATTTATIVPAIADAQAAIDKAINAIAAATTAAANTSNSPAIGTIGTVEGNLKTAYANFGDAILPDLISDSNTTAQTANTAIVDANTTVADFSLLTNPTAQDIANAQAAIDSANEKILTAQSIVNAYESVASEINATVETTTVINTTSAVQIALNTAIQAEIDSDAIVLSKLNDLNDKIKLTQGPIAATQMVMDILKTMPNPTLAEIQQGQDILDKAPPFINAANDAKTLYETTATDAGETIIPITVGDITTVQNYVTALVSLQNTKIDLDAKIIVANDAIEAAKIAVAHFRTLRSPTQAEIQTLKDAIDAADLAKADVVATQELYSGYASTTEKTEEIFTPIVILTTQEQSSLDIAQAKVDLLKNAQEAKIAAQQEIADANTIINDFKLIQNPTPEQIAQAQTAIDNLNNAIKKVEETAKLAGIKPDSTVLSDAKILDVLNTAIVKSNDANIAIEQAKQVAIDFQAITNPTEAEIATAKAAMKKLTEAIAEAKAAATLYANTATSTSNAVDTTISTNLVLVELSNKSIVTATATNIVVKELARIIADPNATQEDIIKASAEATIAKEVSDAAATALTGADATAAIIVAAAPVIPDDINTTVLAEVIEAEKDSDALVLGLLNTANEKSNLANIAVAAAQAAIDLLGTIENPTAADIAAETAAIETANNAIIAAQVATTEATETATLYKDGADDADEIVESIVVVNGFDALTTAKITADAANDAIEAAAQAVADFKEIDIPTEAQIQTVQAAMDAANTAQVKAQTAQTDYINEANESGTAIETIPKVEESTLGDDQESLELITTANEKAATAQTAIDDATAALVQFKTIENPTAEQIAYGQTVINNINAAIAEARIASAAAGVKLSAETTANAKIFAVLNGAIVKSKEAEMAQAEAKQAAETFAKIENPTPQQIETAQAALKKANDAVLEAKASATLYESSVANANTINGTNNTIDTTISSDLVLVELSNTSMATATATNIAVKELARIVADPNATQEDIIKAATDAKIAEDVSTAAATALTDEDSNADIIEVEESVLPADIDTTVLEAAIEAEEASDAIVLDKLNNANTVVTAANEAVAAAQAAIEYLSSLENPTQAQIDTEQAAIDAAKVAKKAATEALIEYDYHASVNNEEMEAIIVVNDLDLYAASNVSTDVIHSAVNTEDAANQAIQLANQAIDLFKRIKNPTPEETATAKKAIDNLNRAVTVAKAAAKAAGRTLDKDIIGNAKVLTIMNTALEESNKANVAIEQAQALAKLFATVSATDNSIISPEYLAQLQGAMDSANRAMAISKAAANLFMQYAPPMSAEDRTIYNNKLVLAQAQTDAITASTNANMANSKLLTLQAQTDPVATAEEIVNAAAAVQVAQAVASVASTSYETAYNNNNVDNNDSETAELEQITLNEPDISNINAADLSTAKTAKEGSDAAIKDTLDAAKEKADEANLAIVDAQKAMDFLATLQNPTDAQKATVKVAIAAAQTAIKTANDATEAYEVDAIAAGATIDPTIVVNTTSVIDVEVEEGAVAFSDSSLSFSIENNTSHIFKVAANGQNFSWEITQAPKNGLVMFLDESRSKAELRYTPNDGTTQTEDKFRIVMTDNYDRSIHTLNVDVQIIDPSTAFVFDTTFNPADNNDTGSLDEIEIGFTDFTVETIKVYIPENSIIKTMDNYTEIKKKNIISEVGTSEINTKVLTNGFAESFVKTNTSDNNVKKVKIKILAQGGIINSTDRSTMGTKSNMKAIANVDGSVIQSVELDGGVFSNTITLSDVSTTIGGIIATIKDTITEITENKIVTTVEVEQDTWSIKAVSSTSSIGRTQTKFIKVDNDTGVETAFDQLLDDSTPYPVGTQIEIKNIDGVLYFEAIATLTDDLIIK